MTGSMAQMGAVAAGDIGVGLFVSDCLPPTESTRGNKSTSSAGRDVDVNITNLKITHAESSPGATVVVLSDRGDTQRRALEARPVLNAVLLRIHQCCALQEMPQARASRTGATREVTGHAHCPQLPYSGCPRTSLMGACTGGCRMQQKWERRRQQRCASD